MLSEALLASIYDIATGEGSFDQTNTRIAEELGYRHGLMSINSVQGVEEIALNQPDIITDGYREHYFKLDPWAGLAASTPFGEPVVTDPDLGKRFYDTEFYVDFAFPIGMVNPLGIRLPLSGGSQLIIGLNQPLYSNTPTLEDQARIGEVSRHVQRSVQLRARLRGAIAEKGSLMTALDRVAFGLAVTTASGRITALNTSGEQAIIRGCGLEVRNNHLLAKDMRMAGQLAALIRDASNGGSGGALRLQAGIDDFVNVLVAPLPPSSGLAQGSRTLVAFRLTSGPTHLNAQLLMTGFGLSRGEAQVAVALMEGKSSDDIALSRGVKATTIKSQLQSLFDKTGTRSQRELVRYLSNLPPLRME